MGKKFWIQDDIERIEYIFPNDEKLMMEIFEEYNFTDELGQPLTHCIPFIKLVQFYYRYKRLVQLTELNSEAAKFASLNKEAANV